MARCNHDHAALKASPALWASLRLAGSQYVPWTLTEAAEVMELRDCPSCSSTLAKIVAVCTCHGMLADAVSLPCRCCSMVDECACCAADMPTDMMRASEHDRASDLKLYCSDECLAARAVEWAENDDQAARETAYECRQAARYL